MPGQPTFLLDLRFIDLTDWWLQLTCCARVTCLPFRSLAVPMVALAGPWDWRIEILLPDRSQPAGL